MADPVIPSTDTVNYVFGFGNAGEAGQDPVIGTLRAQEVLLYFTELSSVVPYAGYQPMVSQPGPINDALYDHPNLLFAIDLALPARGQSAILKTIFSIEQMANFMLVLSNYGTIITAGLSWYPAATLLDDTTGAPLLDDTTGDVLVADSS